MAKKIQLQDKYGNDRYPITTADCVVDSNGNILSDVLKNTYVMPLGGIPKSDLSDNVRASLEKADSALQNIPSDYITETILSGKNYATKDDIDGLVTKGTTLAHYGITDAVINGNYLTPDSPVPTLGFATTANGWPYNGAAIMVGGKGAGQLRLISTLGNSYLPEIFVSGRYLDNESEWARVITDKNIGAYSIALRTADASGNGPKPTDTSAFSTYVYGTNGWKTTGPAMAFPNGNYKGLLNIGVYNPATGDNGVSAYLGVVYAGTQGKWSKILTEHNIGDYAAAKATTLAGYGITDAVYYDFLMNQETVAYCQHIGYGYPAGGWYTAGPAFGFGLPNYNIKIQAENNADAPRLYYQSTVVEAKSKWYKFLFSEGNANIESNAFSARGAMVLHRNADDGPTYLNYGPFETYHTDLYMYGDAIRFMTTSNNGSLLAYAKEAILIDASGTWYQFVTKKNIGNYALLLTGGTIDGSLAITGGITLGDETINSWADAGAMPTKSQTTTSGTVSIAPNVLNKWTNALTGGTLTITFASETSGVANYYMIEFATGANIPTINLPSGITWQGGDNILTRLKPYRTYQISILNNLAVGGEF